MKKLIFQRIVKRVVKLAHLLEKKGVNLVLGLSPVEKLKLKSHVGKT